MDAYRGCFVPGHPRFPKESEAATELQAQGPVTVNAPDINYGQDDDDAIDEYHRLKG